jgi:hypothetical protein
MTKSRLVRGALAAVLAGAGCAQIISFPDYKPGSTGGGGTGGTGGKTGTTSATGGAASSSSSGTAGSGGTGGSACAPDAGGACAELCDTDHPCTGACQWSVSLGDPGTQGARAAALTPEGDVVIAGNTNDLAFLGGADASIPNFAFFVAKLRKADGGVAWSLGIGEATGGHDPRALAVDEGGNIYVVGGLGSALGAIGGTTVTGSYQGGSDILVAKLAPDGSVLWAKDFGSTGADVASAVAVAPGGSVWVTGLASDGIKLDGATPLSAGLFALHLDTDGNHPWGTTIPNADSPGIAVDAQGNVAIAARDTTADDNIALVRIDASLVPQVDRYGDTQLQTGRSVAFDASGHLYLLAQAAGAVDFKGACPALPSPYPPADGGALPGEDLVLARFDPTSAGGCVWAKRFPKLDQDPALLALHHRAQRVVVDGAGNVVLAALVSGTIDFSGGTDPNAPITISKGNYGHVIAKLHADGSYVWSKGTPSVVNPPSPWVSLGLDARAGAIVVAGSHNQAMNLGCGPRASVGALDADVTLLLP